MKKVSGRFIATAVCLLLALSIFAQSNIDRAIAKIEADPLSSVTCTEKRNIDTKKTYKVSKVVKFENNEMALELKNAIKTDSKDAIEYTRVDDRMYYVIFINGKRKIEYMLKRSRSRNGVWILTVEINNSENAPLENGKYKNQSFEFGYDALFLDGNRLQFDLSDYNSETLKGQIFYDINDSLTVNLYRFQKPKGS